MRNTKQSAKIEIDIDCNHPGWTAEKDDVTVIVQDCCTKAIQKSGIDKKTKIIEVSILLTGDDFIKELNSNYRSKDKPTNVLSFPSYDFEAGHYENLDNYVVLGDIILAFETIKKEAIEQEKTFINHLLHLVVHGTLHLLGYDHIDDVDAEVMESLEISLLTDMGVENPYS